MHAAGVHRQSRYLNCAGYEIHLSDWHPPAGQPLRGHVLAWHGLARTGRDMDPLAAHLAAQGWRVACPDTLGRGLSQWARAPEAEYCLAFYARLARELLAQLDAPRWHWVGTSMGGAIGTVAASGLAEPALRDAILSLTLNDNAPELAAPALARIQAYAGQPPVFDTVTQLEAFFRSAYAPYGFLPDAQWRLLTESSVRRLPDGRVTPHYDPAIMGQFTHHPQDYLLWPHYDALRIPVLLLRGAQSDLVLPEVVQRMHTRGPGAAGLLQTHEVPGCGHAPALNVPAQWALVTDFLDRAAARTSSGSA